MEGFSGADWVIAIATVALFIATAVLALFTKRLSDATGKPQVVATIDVSRWSMLHVDLRVENTGNASAFDIHVSFEPPLPRHNYISDSSTPPLHRISLLRPSQHLISSLCKASNILDAPHTATVSWAQRPNGRKRETLIYTIDLGGIRHLTRLGAESPEVQIADQIKKLREDWQYVANGSRRLSVDSYSSADREARNAAIQESFHAEEERQTTETKANKPPLSDSES
jgi:hypothetical protein